jgi:hypothetical protein
MRRRSTRSLLAWSLVGLIGGHQATYLLLYRDPALMGGILDATGHGWLALAPIFVLSAALTALVLGFHVAEPVRSLRWRFTFLALIQGLTFVAIEFAERFGGGIDVGPLLAADWPILVVGVAMQVAVAAVLAIASRVVERVAALLARHRTTNPHRRPIRVVRPSLVLFGPATSPGSGHGPRAPPVLA